MKQEQGFTLVELLVSIGIFTVITAVAVFNHAQFNGTVLLTNLTYEIALSVRQAQFYGITVRQSSADPTKFDSGYGIHFDLSTPTTYLLFEDGKNGNPQNHVYNAGLGTSTTEALEYFSIQRGNKISKLCLAGDCSKTVADISFIRPNPDTYITAGGIASTYYTKAEICVSSPQSMKRKIVVESTGQISVDTDTSGICN